MRQDYREIPTPLQGIWDVLDDHFATTPSFGRMVFRAAAFVLITGGLLLPYVIAGFVSRPAKRAIELIWYRTCAAICSLSITVRGDISNAPATLFTSNHVSYLDILILGQLVQARFVAKSDVADWPLFGLLAKLAGTVFVTRDRRQALNDSKHLTRLMGEGERLILFPEGTSSNGRTVLPFMRALFAAVDPNGAGKGTVVQPVTIAYIDYADGRPLKNNLSDLYAWYGDMTLFGHLMTVFGLKGARIEVTFHKPLDPSTFEHRKDLALATENAVRQGLQTSFDT